MDLLVTVHCQVVVR